MHEWAWTDIDRTAGPISWAHAAISPDDVQNEMVVCLKGKKTGPKIPEIEQNSGTTLMA